MSAGEQRQLAEDGAAPEEAQRPGLLAHLPRHLGLAGDDDVQPVRAVVLGAHHLVGLDGAVAHAHDEVDEGVQLQLGEERQGGPVSRVGAASGVRRGEHLDGAVAQLLAHHAHQVRLHLAVIERLGRQRRRHRGAPGRAARGACMQPHQRVAQAPLLGRQLQSQLARRHGGQQVVAPQQALGARVVHGDGTLALAQLRQAARRHHPRAMVRGHPAHRLGEHRQSPLELPILQQIPPQFSQR
jgi:hypothetical protein